MPNHLNDGAVEMADLPYTPKTRRALSKQDVIDATKRWPCSYESETGLRFIGATVTETPKRLIEAGWRNVSHLDESDFLEMGLRVVTARYVGGARPKRFCRVIIAGEMKEKGR
jgi:hypothetical protein